MANKVQLVGPFAAIRYRAVLQVETGPYAPRTTGAGSPRRRAGQRDDAADGTSRDEDVPPEPFASQDVDRVALTALQGDRTGPDEPGPLAGLRRDLTAEAQRVFDSTSVEVAEIRFQRGSLEVLVILGAVATVIKDFGAIAQGLREMGRLIPGRLREFLEERCGAALQGRVTTRLSPEAVELRPGMRDRDAPSPADDRDAQAPVVEPRPQPVGTPSAAEGRAARYLLVSNVVLTVLLAAIVIVMLVRS